MIKVQIDPITGKVLSYTKVAPNTLVYREDLLMDEADIPRENADKMLYSQEGFAQGTDSFTQQLQDLEEQLQELGNRSDSEYFFQAVMEGKSIEEARTQTAKFRAEVEELWERRNTLIQEHERQIQEYYLEKNRTSDACLKCLYYSAVVLLIKDENRYLEEWIDWHLALGFDHIYIYDNGIRERVEEVTGGYEKEKKKKITVIDWSGHHDHIQQDAYNHFLENFKEKVRWGLFIDSDEFLRFTSDVPDVNTFLKEYEDYTEIWGYEVEYDANGQEAYEEKPVRERFTRQTDAREGFYFKNFIQVNRIDSFLMHYAYYDEAKHLLFKSEQSNRELFVIDHYYTKSWEEWQKKIKERGGADPNYRKALSEFFVYNPDMRYLDSGDQAVQAYE